MLRWMLRRRTNVAFLQGISSHPSRLLRCVPPPIRAHPSTRLNHTISEQQSTTADSPAPATKDFETEDGVRRSRHLLRAILRECTYLPDSFTRQWMSQYALQRFRTYNFKAWKYRNHADYGARLHAKEKEARNWVTYLRRANEGERKCLMRVLFMAYGRIGKRRHQLMMPLMPKKGGAHYTFEEIDFGGESDGESAANVQSQPMTDSPQHSVEDIMPITNETLHLATQNLEPVLTPPLRALLTSQIRASPPYLARRNPKQLTKKVPSVNAWLHPMPQKRVRNMRNQFYAELLERVLPPLPTQEWHRLVDLANGRTAIEQPTRRRSLPSQPRVGEHSALEAVVLYGKPPTKLLKKRGMGHALTPRFMRRLYGEVLSQCPLMDWDADAKKWKVVWGRQALQQDASSNPTMRPNERHGNADAQP